jgi:hypothetical protein
MFQPETKTATLKKSFKRPAPAVKTYDPLERTEHLRARNDILLEDYKKSAIPVNNRTPKLVSEDFDAKYELLREIYNIKKQQPTIGKVIFVRHGQSIWNKSGKFQGWTDVPLSEQGEEESREAGKLLKNLGYEFDVVYTSMLKRATKTADLILEEMGTTGEVDMIKNWKLNERHYGSL